ncbi:MAG: hypothetical protein MRY78_14180 [Saprospiraceae bacterium]|nr:hypothetical protein [Saprospiraceae bacterium]
MIQKGIFTLAALMLLSFTTFAQAKKEPNPEKRAERIEKMVTDLNLDEATATSFKQIEEDFFAKAKELRAQELERSEKREQLKALQTAKDEQIKELLSDEQYAKYQELQPKRGKRKGKRGGKRS